MNENRTSYVKVLPLVFLAGLLLAGLSIYRDYQYNFDKPVDQLWYLDLSITIFKNAVIWMAIGAAFRQWKAAVVAMVISLVLSITHYFVSKYEIGRTSVVLNYLYTLLNVNLLPALVFGLVCFKKQSLRYFLPLWLFSYAATMMYVGSVYLDASPYNAWYRLLHIDRILQIRTSEISFRVLNFLSYLFNIVVIAVTVVAVGESYAAATANKKWKALFHIDLSTNYTKAGAIALFFSLRLLINMLVIGLFTFPLAHFFEEGRFYFRDQSLFTFFMVMISGSGLLIATVLYYRRFMVEYFISHHKKIQWSFWVVNMPIVGMFVFPFVALAAPPAKPVEDRTRFFYNNAMYSLQPYNIMGVMLGLSLLINLFGSSMGNSRDVSWLLWLVEAGLFIWYVASSIGYQVILGFGILGLILFFSKMGIAKQSGGASAHFLDDSFLLWFIAGFNVVQYTIFLPVFHLNEMKVVQKNEELEMNEEVGILFN